jgi:NSS family neurotransmitter:Na+ symporter
MKSKNDYFSSKWGLIFAAAGSAIGLGNIWLFPYRVGEFGGAIFIIPYMICLVILGSIALIGEITIGRLTSSGPIGAFEKALELDKKKNKSLGYGFGLICVFVALIQAIGYILVVAWVIRFILGSISGSAFYTNNSSQYFSFISNSNVMLWIIISLLITAITVMKGVEKGIEKCCKIMIPGVIILLLVLVVRVMFLPNAIHGYKYLFNPTKYYNLFNAKIWMFALGQVFYSLSIRGSTMVVYGSYVKKTQDIVFSAKSIVILDTLASILSVLLIIPAVFAFNKDLNSGPSLLFITMPEIFKNIPFGQFLMFIFFVAVFFAALTSLIGMIEVAIEMLQNKFQIPRFPSIIFICTLVGLTCKWFVIGNLTKIIDILSLHLIPLCALGSSIFTFWIIPKDVLYKEIQTGRVKKISKFLIPMGRYILCGTIILIYIMRLE